MPAVRPVSSRRGMVPGDSQYIGRELQQLRQQGIYAFDDLNLGVEIAVLAAGISVLDMDEKEVVFAKGFTKRGKFLSMDLGVGWTSMPSKREIPWYMG